MSYSQTIGTGRDALHVSFLYKTASAKAAKGTFICTVICERWSGPTNPKGRTRRSTGISVLKKFILKDGKVSERAPNVDEVRKQIDGVVARIRKVYEDYVHARTDDNDVLRKSKIEDVIDARRAVFGDTSVFVTRSVRAHGSRGAEYGGFVRRFLDEYRMKDGRSYEEAPRAKANAETMAFNLWLFSNHYYGGKLSVQDLADPDMAPHLAAKLVRFLSEERDEPLVDTSIDNLLRRLRTALRWAHRIGVVRTLDLSPYAFNAARQPKITLTPDDFQRVVEFRFDVADSRLERARDLWVFHCLTALRYTDGQKLGKLNPDDSAFTVTTSKTGKRVTIPMFDLTSDIIRKYPDGLPTLSNQKLNRYIKEVLEKVGLTQEVEIPVIRKGQESTLRMRLCDAITTHTGRRQFVTVARVAQIPDSIIKEITGHTNLDEIDTYTNVPKESILKHVSSLNAAFGRLAV